MFKFFILTCSLFLCTTCFAAECSITSSPNNISLGDFSFGSLTKEKVADRYYYTMKKDIMISAKCRNASNISFVYSAPYNGMGFTIGGVDGYYTIKVNKFIVNGVSREVRYVDTNKKVDFILPETAVHTAIGGEDYSVDVNLMLNIAFYFNPNTSLGNYSIFTTGEFHLQAL
ncbi:hypothetical protein GA254_18135 [Escherichia coli]|uniref:Uncharacterized protein n=2 Tax=Escherichia coli TaxID=562 RepID=A0ABC8EAK9_ECOLX|nr:MULTISPECIES: hypothetical protein [Escherichia]EFH9448556.1 hypothetical protein [Escherichia coli]EFL9915062.1 hypothetical protein [Escherichia coli]EFM0094807.1 hypothetical protein [Escherichia coli]EFN5485828.1 hypothetical protein [Escherichia coli]EHK1638756.1 hypothetical protein [Escherichia coli]